ncbi:hypothetical protein PG991_014587 [Apiospora marii]|uniref:Uncharacterized protein n=1 Tax=Apiospora marii TaxID=335849 RepID=A0ABR1R3Y6_9PEZI
MASVMTTRPRSPAAQVIHDHNHDHDHDHDSSVAARIEPQLTPTEESKSLHEFNACSITEVLEQDSRPTFVIDLDPDESVTIGASRILPVFCNSALRLHEPLHDTILGKGAPDTQRPYEEFSSWATGVTKFDDSRDVFPLSHLFHDMIWTGSTVRKRWRLISGNLYATTVPVRDLSVVSGRSTEDQLGSQRKRKYSVDQTDRSSTLVSAMAKPAPPPKLNSSSSSNNTASTQSKKLYLAAPDKAVADWTAPKPRGILSPHMQFARSIQWENTPLGPMKKWSPEFRQTVNLVMNNPHPATLFWGSDLTMLYNEPYAIEVAGNKHPALMGTGFSGPFSELWDAVSGVFAECARTGIAIRKDDDYLPIERYGLLEETFWSWSWTPLYGGTDRILGFYNAPFECTQSVLSHRRMSTINRLGETVSRAKSVKQFWRLLLEGLEDNHFDVPFALLYSVGDSDETDQVSVSSGSTISLKSCHLEGTIGVREGHVAAPKQLDLKRSREGFIPAFREAMRTREPLLLHTRDGTLPEELLEDMTFRGFGDPCDSAIIFPVRPTNGDMVLGFLLVGVNPRRPYDNGYRSFTSMLHRQLATSLASFMLYEEEVRRSRDAAEAAALEQEHLTQQLALQTSRLRRMTELSPLGMFLVDTDGVLREGNDRYFEMTGHPRENLWEMSWMEQIAESSKKHMQDGWHQMVVERTPWSGEVQMKKIYVQPVDLNGEAIEYWLLVTSQPELAPDGSVRSIMGSITDISHLKWAQGLQNRRLQEAEETRRQQNEFIDITSHEMRNPLSAILQCSDDIVSTLDIHRGQDSPPSTEDVENCLDAARTISLCVQHQKSIVDDILTVSKLDSNLLVITPTPAQPTEVLRRAVKMFEPELQAKDIQMVTHADESFRRLDVDWVNFDPSRVLQILINLVTNAIKFTAAADHRVITVSVAVSQDPSSDASAPGFQYIPVRTPNVPANPVGEDWGDGEMVYLRFQVSDTGCGLTPEEVKVLFERFSQASPRTHAQYGGSGLGLFICRQLAELHGGQIGVSSKADHGSTFAFFITARRATTPDNPALKRTITAMETAVTGSPPLTKSLPPQRQDFASTNGPAADLVTDLVSAKAAPLFDQRELQVLVVEDNLVNQTVLVKQLKKAGIGVSAANDGLEALAFLDQTVYRRGADDNSARKLSVILMDLEMPNMDGLTCVREIRKMQRSGQIRGHVPVIAVTANVRDEQIVAAKRSGMDDVVSKPFRIPDLIRKIEVLLGNVADNADLPSAEGVANHTAAAAGGNTANHVSTASTGSIATNHVA